VIDFTFNNTYIKKYFDTGENPPIKEFLYLHEHPMVKPNFILELEKQLRGMTIVIQSKNIKGAIINDVTNIAIRIGAELANNPLNEDNAKAILTEMRNGYQLGLKLGVKIVEQLVRQYLNYQRLCLHRRHQFYRDEQESA